MLDYVYGHFAHELQLQTQNAYPGYAGHKQFHEGYKRKLQDIAAQIPPAGPSVADLNNLNMHIGKLISHIKIEDKKLGAFLKK